VEGRGGEDGLTVHARLACPGLLDGLVPALAGLVTGSVVLFTAASTEEVGTFPAWTLNGLNSFATLDTFLAIDVVDDVVFAFYMGGRGADAADLFAIGVGSAILVASLALREIWVFLPCVQVDFSSKHIVRVLGGDPLDNGAIWVIKGEGDVAVNSVGSV